MNDESRNCMMGALVVLILGLALIIGMNGTNWIALQNGYCQEVAVGRGVRIWVKCNGQ